MPKSQVEDLIKECLSYDPETGELTWVKPTHPRIKVGQKAGYINQRGYPKVKIGKKVLFQHRVAWFLTYDYWPEVVDHIDGDTKNNRLENLRETNRFGNARNKAAKEGNRFKGVYFKSHKNRFEASITVNGQYHHLGVFASETEGARAYDEAAFKHFGEFARLNFPQEEQHVI